MDDIEQGGHTALKVIEKIFQGLESPWKWNRALKVLEFDVRGPWKFLNFNTSELSLPRCELADKQQDVGAGKLSLINCHVVVVEYDCYVIMWMKLNM